MPLPLAAGAPTILVRRRAYEQARLSRAAIDDRFGLTADEFRVEGDLVAIGPIFEEASLPEVVAAFEAAGLTYFDDFFELSGNWPGWLTLFASVSRAS